MTPSQDGRPGVDQVLAGWLSGELAERVLHVEFSPERPGDAVPWPDWSDPEAQAAWTRQGIVAPWRHQVEAAQALWDGQHTWVGTGTASGKSLAYLLPTLTALRDGTSRRPRRWRPTNSVPSIVWDCPVSGPPRWTATPR